MSAPDLPPVEHVPGQLTGDWLAAPVVGNRPSWATAEVHTIADRGATVRSVYDRPAQLGPYEPVGKPIAGLSLLWAQLVTDGPTTDSVTQVQFLTARHGQIHVRFLSQVDFLLWAEHLALGFRGREQFGGSSLLLTARGSVTRDGRTAEVSLTCPTNVRDVTA